MRWISLLMMSAAVCLAGEAVACSVSATPVSFGSYEPSQSFPSDAEGTITVSCPSSSAYVIRLDPGSAGVFSPSRTMIGAGGGDSLDYNLYRNSSRTEAWGDGTNNTYEVSGSTAGEATHTIYGRIFKGQNISAGSYADTLTITVVW